MVQAKAKKLQKRNPKKQSSQGKKNGKPTNNAQFVSQLDALGLKIVPLVADGNCFFRGIADQLEGNEEEHAKYRHMVVEYIKKHREEFEPFIEDDVPFDEYCQSMESDGTWAGHMEIQAASLVFRSNICIHRNMSPRWYIKNFPDNGTHMIHLSYHDGEHYNSIRTKEDPCDGPARLVIIEADVELSASEQAKTSVEKAKSHSGGKTTTNPSSIKIVMSGSGCIDPKKVEGVLQEVHGNVDAAIEFLLAEGADETMEDADEATTGKDSTVCASIPLVAFFVVFISAFWVEPYIKVPPSKDIETKRGKSAITRWYGFLVLGDLQNVICEQSDAVGQSVKVDGISDHSTPKKDAKRDGNVLPIEEKKIPRNKVCPCGSRKKYKACCGAAAGRSSVRIEMKQKVVSNKMRKEQSRQGKAESHSNSPLVGSESGKLDLGALCI